MNAIHPKSNTIAPFPLTALLFVFLVQSVTADTAIPELTFERPRNAVFTFRGPMGDRIQANLESWLLTAPQANPGMIEMFRIRDRKPVPQLVPWAGEFVGKYLISAIQARRMVNDPRLDETIRTVISDLIVTQADDGYLGPFRKEERLLGNWDLWGHYHVMLALMMWHEDTGDEAAKTCAIKAADLICNTYLDTGRRVIDAKSCEMNMAVIHVLGRLYRETGNERYIRMMREIETDIADAGDYYRQGLAGTEFYRMPLPRWESLHDIQGLIELYRITGNEDYRIAFENIWRSIAWYDRHNTGGFSTGEQAIGDPYEPGAIETCCTTAWSAISVDMLHLTGDLHAADELELSVWNSILGSQHPSGRWWTYNTPMDGQREASAHTIVFQARAGSPELNCCSVNAPRGIGMLSEWAVSANAESVAINYYGPMSATIPMPSGATVNLTQETEYPADGHIKLTIAPCTLHDEGLLLRIPSWSAKTTVSLDGKLLDTPTPGRYLHLKPNWSQGAAIELDLDMSIHTWIGDGAAAGKISLYYGPLLLAFDTHFNSYDTDDVPNLSIKNLQYERRSALRPFQPIVLFRFTGMDGRPVQLCDFATAGAFGTQYRSWLPVADAPPAHFFLRAPKDGATIPPGPNTYEWTGPSAKGVRRYTLAIAKDQSMEHPIVKQEFDTNRVILRETLPPGETYFWQVTSTNEYGEQAAVPGPRRFYVDASMPNPFLENPALFEYREDGLVTASPLDGDGTPSYGVLLDGKGVLAAEDRAEKPNGAVAFNGRSMLKYRIPFFPDEAYTVMVWVKPEAEPENQLAQIFSAWAKGGDDPLRITLEGGKLYARIEGPGGGGTAGHTLRFGEWIHVAAVRGGNGVRLYVNGEPAGEFYSPGRLRTSSVTFALGGNPLHTGPEFFKGVMDDFVFYARAMTQEEIRASLEKN